MTIRYAHTNLVARDWKSLAEFYIAVFGCRPQPPERDLRGPWVDALTGLPGAHIRGIHLLLPGYDGPTLEIFQYDENWPRPTKRIHEEGFGHIAILVDDVEGCLALVRAHGGATVGQVVTSTVAGVGVLHVVYATDPEGNILEIQHWSYGA